jgi:nitronate monooxygenase
MGFYISTWFLARVVSMLGGLGTISGVALERVLAVILQMGDPGGHFRRALAHFPFRDVANKVLETYYIEVGNPQKKRLQYIPVFRPIPLPMFIELSVCANFAVVWLAKEGHDGLVSINYLEKIPPHIYAIFGAMLAGVDYITMGAGIPRQTPGIISAIMEGRVVEYYLNIERATKPYKVSFDPRAFFGVELPPMKRPGFLPIVTLDRLANILKTKLPQGSIDGFVFENPTAGGHNAPPRPRKGGGNKFIRNTRGEPVYDTEGEDKVHWDKVKDLGIPFYIGGSCASPEMLSWALSVGASGIQVGTIFALCEESGMKASLKAEARRLGFLGELDILTDPLVSPSGFPFKVARICGTLSDNDVRGSIMKVCRHCCLKTYEEQNGLIEEYCPAGPLGPFLAKGGKLTDTIGRCCLCGALMAAAGLGSGPAIVTLGDDAPRICQAIMNGPDDSYSAARVFEYLLGPVKAA